MEIDEPMHAACNESEHDWEYSKENFMPVRTGRNPLQAVKALAAAAVPSMMAGSKLDMERQ